MTHDWLTPRILEAVRWHGISEAPREACGLIVLIECDGPAIYVRAKNLAQDASQFMIDPASWVNAEDRGEIVAIAHTHPARPPAPSTPDRVGCEATGLPWLIVSVPSGAHQVVEPCGFVAPYEGREFAYGILDCYTLACDWLRRERGVAMPARGEFHAPDGWWLGGDDLYMREFRARGFAEFGADHAGLAPGDLVLMQIASPVANHIAVYAGEGLILNHLVNRLSAREIYDGWWRKATRAIFRHPQLAASSAGAA